MVVYIDVLFAVNLILNYFTLLAVSMSLRRKDRRLRILLGASFGALYAVFMFFPEVHYLYSALAKVSASAVIVLVAFRCNTLRSFLKLLICFYLINFLFGGIIFAVWLFFAPPGMFLRNGVLYVDISPVALILAGAGCYLVIALAGRILGRSRASGSIYKIQIVVCGRSRTLEAMLDTGNSLTDAISGAPVIVAEYAALERLIPEPLRPAFKNGVIAHPEDFIDTGWADRLRMIPYGAVNKTGGLLPAFRPDKIVILLKKSAKEVTDVIVAVCSDRLSGDGRYAALLNPQLMNL